MAWTNRQTDKQTDRGTWRLYDWIGPVGRFSENPQLSTSWQLFVRLLEAKPSWRVPLPLCAELLNPQYWTPIRVLMYYHISSRWFYSALVTFNTKHNILILIYIRSRLAPLENRVICHNTPSNISRKYIQSPQCNRVINIIRTNKLFPYKGRVPKKKGKLSTFGG